MTGLEHSKVLLLLLGTGTLLSWFWLMKMQNRLNIKWYSALLIAFLHTVYGVATVKVFAALENIGNPEFSGGMSLFGGVFFMPIAYFLGAKITKKKVSEVFDIFTICMIFTVMCARVNCLYAGCCIGNPIPFITDHTVRWPTRELELFFYIILLVILIRKELKEKTHGEIYPIYMMVYGGFRFIVEWFRYSERSLGMIHLAHIWSLIALGIGMSIYMELIAQQVKRKVRG